MNEGWNKAVSQELSVNQLLIKEYIPTALKISLMLRRQKRYQGLALITSPNQMIKKQKWSTLYGKDYDILRLPRTLLSSLLTGGMYRIDLLFNF